ncbi:glycosyltransferase family 25 protein [Ochrobactrum sp. SFR4]|uniref:glycosyltransferase family 25 protein n=1 Tax=Ochrobactrum sp. SFR4 TaxID=2717368 RepID=UPI001C8C308F|nr:glycosyltransferase family 25 protein [Ochrobactrum sp. SFR4]MBX8827395.1 glycosyltransferase family 25 protein [Ochrobactrum sp. SFR4]
MEKDPVLTRASLTASGKVKAFIIHLARATRRKPQVDALINELPIASEIIQALDGAELSEDDVALVYRRYLHEPRYPFRLRKSEIACFLSHRKAWQSIVDQKLLAGFILEDDITLTSDFPEVFRIALDYLIPGGFIRFPIRDDRESGPEIFNNGNARIIVPCTIGLRMMAQLVSYEAAERLLAVTRTFDRPVDTTVQMKWVTKLQPYSIFPGGVKEISSTLGGSTVQQRKNLLEKLKREVIRPIYRTRVRRFSSKQI